MLIQFTFFFNYMPGVSKEGFWIPVLTVGILALWFAYFIYLKAHAKMEGSKKIQKEEKKIEETVPEEETDRNN